MPKKPKFLGPEDFVAALKLSAARQAEATAAEMVAYRRAKLIAHCEDFYAKLDGLLPTHVASRDAARYALTRMQGTYQ